MKDWRYQYPSVTTSLKIFGDQVYGELFLGEAKNLLYQVKNLMVFNRLGQLSGTRYFRDGTRITARSIFGQDFIEILPGRGIEGEGLPSCSITLINVPNEISPMKWYSDGVHTFPDGSREVEGTDYIKTYYSLWVRDCPLCDQEWSVCRTSTLLSDVGFLTGGTKCRPFFYKKEGLPAYQGQPKNHCIYGYCQGQIIEFGADEGGQFFVWKAYTEWSNLGPWNVDFSKTGLGYMRLKVAIKDEKDTTICSAEHIVKVDCCLKPLIERISKIYWEKCDFAEWCPASELNEYSDLMYFWRYGGWNVIYMRLLPEDGGCIPFEWTLEGKGQLETYDEIKREATYKIPTEQIFEDCRGQIKIEVRDRCGSSDTVIFLSRCEEAEPLEIGYTSLLMSCGAAQALYAVGGSGPYQWSLSGGGFLQEDPTDPNKSSVVYNAPANNPDCILNPTIMLDDCCGNSASIKLAVNCYIGSALALKNCEELSCSHDCQNAPPQNWCHYHAIEGKWEYRCDSVLLNQEFIKYPGQTIPEFDCAYQGGEAWGCSDYPDCWPNPSPCESECMYRCTYYCHPDGCGLHDKRTPTMKEQGCCPLNPLTGLPY